MTKHTMSQYASLDDLLAAQKAERIRDAAPDLLAALELLVNDIARRPECAHMALPLRAAQDAIAKAKGE